MSVHIFPCNRCPLREGCEQKAEFAKRVAGIGARSVAFRCDKLANEIRTGRRIVIKQLQPVGFGRYEDDGLRFKRVEVPATISSWRPNYSFGCVVDKGAVTVPPDILEIVPYYEPERFRFRKNQPHYRIVRFLDEPDRRTCIGGQILSNGQCEVRDGDCYCKAIEEITS